jgi:hypothetical protein
VKRGKASKRKREAQRHLVISYKGDVWQILVTLLYPDYMAPNGKMVDE